MNQYRYDSLIYRNYVYLSRIVSSLFNKGDKLKEYKLIQIYFNNFYNKYDKCIDRLSLKLRDNKERLSIMDEIEYLAEQQGMIDLYNFKREQKRIMAYENEKGYEKGKAEGIVEGVEKIALNLINMNYKDDDISKAAGLTIEEIQNLKEL